MTRNGKEIVLPAAAGGPARVGQATAVEQSRVVAEVQARVIVAQNCPRNVDAAIAEMEQSCTQIEMAEKAKFRFSRGGSMVSGPSVYLARELIRCWGNAEANIDEMLRDDVHGQSEMLAWAWDLQTNTRISTKFIVPHVRDRSAEKGGPVRLTDMRDIYENNANAGARRLRECMLNILPPWFVERAKALCEKTLKEGGGEPLPVRVRNLIARFEELGVTRTQLERKQGRGSNAWTVEDVAALTVVGRSLAAGETTRDDEFEPDILSVSDLPDAVPTQPTPATVPDAAPAPPAPEQSVETGTVTHLVSDEDLPTVLTELGLTAEQPTPAAPAAADDAGEPDGPPSGDGSKASRMDIAKLVNLLGDNEVKSRVDQLAVISLLVDERVAAMPDVTASEVAYLLKRIPELVEAGTFAGSVERARQEANA